MIVWMIIIYLGFKVLVGICSIKNGIYEMHTKLGSEDCGSLAGNINDDDMNK